VAALEARLGAREMAGRPEVKQDPASLRRELRRPLRPERTVSVRLPSLYSPVPYLPPLLGVAVGRALELSAAACVYAGRLGSLLAYVLLVALALRRAPAHRYALGLIATTPMAVFEAGALAADAATNALALLFFASVLGAAGRRGPLRTRELLELCGLAALLGLSKQAYVPLALSAALIPAERFSGPRARLGALAALLAAATLPTALWLAAVQQANVQPLTRASDPAAQIRFVLGHPLETARTFLVTGVAHSLRYVRTFVGHLGYLDVRLPLAVYIAHPIVMLGVAVADGGRASPVRGWGRGILLATAALTWIAVMAMAYVGWNRPGDELVRYVQGRYFIPLAPLVVCAVHLGRGRGLSRPLALGALAAGALVLAVGTVALAQRYWAPA
jgi:uncharacterized membrane protein